MPASQERRTAAGATGLKIGVGIRYAAVIAPLAFALILALRYVYQNAIFAEQLLRVWSGP